MNTTLADLTAIMHRFYSAETAYVEAGRQDFSVIAQLLHSECTMHAPESLPYGGVWRGYEGFERWTQGFADFWSKLEVFDPQFHEVGQNLLFIRSMARGTVRATGAEVEWPLLQQVRFESGLLAEIWPFYWDSAAIVAAMAPPQN